MPEIFCSNRKCEHFKKGKCSKEEINVDGSGLCLEATDLADEDNLNLEE